MFSVFHAFFMLLNAAPFFLSFFYFCYIFIFKQHSVFLFFFCSCFFFLRFSTVFPSFFFVCVHYFYDADWSIQYWMRYFGCAIPASFLILTIYIEKKKRVLAICLLLLFLLEAFRSPYQFLFLFFIWIFQPCVGSSQLVMVVVVVGNVPFFIFNWKFI